MNDDKREKRFYRQVPLAESAENLTNLNEMRMHKALPRTRLSCRLPRCTLSSFMARALASPKRQSMQARTTCMLRGARGSLPFQFMYYTY